MPDPSNARQAAGRAGCDPAIRRGGSAPAQARAGGGLACLLVLAVSLLAACAATARAETFTVTARVPCPASLSGTEPDTGFTVTPTFVPCAGIRVTAMGPRRTSA